MADLMMNRFIGRHAELEELTCRVESAEPDQAAC